MSHGEAISTDQRRAFKHSDRATIPSQPHISYGNGSVVDIRDTTQSAMRAFFRNPPGPPRESDSQQHLPSRTGMSWRAGHEQELRTSGRTKSDDCLLEYTSGEDDISSVPSSSDDEPLSDTDEEDDFVEWVHPRRRTPRRPATAATEASVIATIRLAEEVEELRRRRFEMISLQLSRSLNSDRRDRLLTTALEYFETFRVGFLSPRLPDIMQYLSSRIDHTLFSYGSDHTNGTKSLIEQWQRYTRMLPSISIRVRATDCTHFMDPSDPVHLHASESDSTITTWMVEARGTLHGFISKYAVRTIFPHLQHRHDLTHKLLNKELDCPISLRFYFNCTGRVIRLDLHADFFQALSAVPGIGIVDLVQIMDQAMIGENSVLPEVVEVDEDGDELRDIL